MKKISYITILIFLCLILGVPTFWWQKYKNLNEKKIEIENKKIELKNTQDYHSYLEDLSSKIEENKENFSKIDDALPEKEDLEKIINFLAKSSYQSGLLLERIETEKPSLLTKDTKILKNPFKLYLIGTYGAIKNLILLLQESSRLPNLEFIKLNKTQDPSVFFIELKVSFNSY